MYTDLETIIHDYNDEKIWGVYVYKRYTPYEIENKFSDQQNEEYTGDFRIVSAIELPNTDIFLGCKRIWVEDKYDENNDLYDSELGLAEEIEYFKLSDISCLVDKTDSEEYRDVVKRS